jgi:Fe-S cluster biogenesis protein NfuA
MAGVTLREGVTTTLMTAFPEITEVLDVTDHDAGENPYYSG